MAVDGIVLSNRRKPMNIEPAIEQQVKRMRTFATGLLVFMGLLFILSNLFRDAQPWVSWVGSFAEAAMVGALADWYAVTALFKHPLGLRMPHTNIIADNKDRIGQRLGDFVQQKFLTPDRIAHEVESLDLASRMALALADPLRRKSIEDQAVRLIVWAMKTSEDQATQRFLREVVVNEINATSFVPLVGRTLTLLLSATRGHGIADRLLKLALDFLRRFERDIRIKVIDKLPFVLRIPQVDRWVAEEVVERIKRMVEDMINNPDDDFRRKLTEQTKRVIAQLSTSEKWKEREAALKAELFNDPCISSFVEDFLRQLRDRILAGFSDEESCHRNYLNAGLQVLGDTLKNDAAFRGRLNGWLRDAVYTMMSEHSDWIKTMILTTMKKWPVQVMVKTIEVQVGRDLQFIRINGTVVGGLVGLLLHAVVLILQAH
jgi:uncharacterized membrane-anchored protein YjiN (DUF445 family)